MADDAERMEAMRQKRAAEMQSEHVSRQQQEAERKRQQEEIKHSILVQILSPEARERLARIRLVKEEKANAIEMMLIQAAQAGKIQGQVTDAYLVKMLEQINGTQETRGPKVTIQRRKGFDSDDD
eukprot:c1906_g1_i1.p1 GENE.c1906_g1_i1~~c1906_g1_i1.p1  ORF type:complete len:137 (-),score=35.69 c1906_g1_i1:36-410(-)